MSSALWIKLRHSGETDKERLIDHDLCALEQAVTVLNELAEQAQVTPFYEFIDYSDAVENLADELPDDVVVPPTPWKTIPDGLTALRALLAKIDPQESRLIEEMNIAITTLSAATNEYDQFVFLYLL